ncbi:MAG: hypothetical protein KC621_32695, partial [Myxococcales bacterium]|nr:hypothetical protein [Myxococcales bacterium]
IERCAVDFAWDADGDGDADAVGEGLLDERGRMVVSTRDWDRDGTSDEITRWTWSDAGRTHEEEDRDADGVVDATQDWVYDEQGRVLELVVDDPADHTHNQTRNTFEGDLLVRRVVDEDVDGVDDRVVTYDYDADGRLILEQEDKNGDGEVQVWVTHSYDEAGREVLVERDVQIDGKIDTTTVTVYDAETGLSGTTVVTTRRPDVVESMVTRTYDDDGRLVYLRDDEAPVDGVPAIEEWIGYDGDRAVSWTGTMDVGGGLLAAFATHWAHDDAGHLVEATTELTLPGERTELERTTWTYDCDGSTW